MRVVVFGSTGFIGSEFSTLIKSQGHELVALGRTAPQKMDFHHPETWKHFLQKNDSVVFMLAPLAGEEESHWKSFQELLKLCSEVQVGHFLFLSSGGAVYGRGEKKWKESDELNPISPYGKFKKQCEELIQKQNFPWAIARPSNIYGEKQSPHKRFGAVTTFYYQIDHGIELSIYGNLDIKKDFLHVKDLCEALSLIIAGKKVGTYNLGLGESHSLKEMITYMEEVTGKKAQMKFFPLAVTDIPYYELDCKKAEKELNWIAKIHLKDGILRYKDKR